MTVEMAVAKLIISLSYLVWIIPILYIIEMYTRYTTGTLETWQSSPFTGVLTALITAALLFKVIDVIDKQLTFYNEKYAKK